MKNIQLLIAEHFIVTVDKSHVINSLICHNMASLLSKSLLIGVGRCLSKGATLIDSLSL